MADKIVAEYIVKTDKAVKNLNKLEKEVKDLQKQGKKSAKGIEDSFKKTSNNLVSQFKKIGGALAIAFSAQQAFQLGKEMVTLAAKAEGVERAFKRIAPKGLLDDLRRATRGTVSDLLLMQRSVQASNFKIPLETLAGLLKFASARARETGESVDFLVDSIVLGIGRKSPLILDNLGISAVELRTRLKGVGVEATSVADIAKIVGDIATEELEKMGEQADTTADKLAQMGAAYENALKKGGAALINASSTLLDAFGIINENQTAIDDFVDSIQGLSSVQLNDKLTEQLSEIESIRSRQNQLSKINNQLTREATSLEGDKLKANKEVRDQVFKERAEAREAIIDQNDFVRILRARLKLTTDIAEKGGDFDFVTPEQINALKLLNDEQKKAIENVAFYKKLIQDLVKEQDAEATSLDRLKTIIPELESAREKLAILLGKETEAMKEARKAAEDYEKGLRKLLKAKIEAQHAAEEQANQDALDGINFRAALDVLFTTQSISEAEGRSDALLQIEQDRLKAILEARRAFGLETIEQEQALAALQAGILDGQVDAEIEANDKKRQAKIDHEDDIRKIAEAAAEFALELTSLITNAIVAGHNAEIDSLRMQLDAGQISREEFDQKRRNLERKKAIDEKNAAIFQAVISTALGVAAALQVAPPLGFVLAALAGALGAVQIGVIAGTPLPTFADGGWVDAKGNIHGQSHAQGGVHIEAEGDEFIVKGKQAKSNKGLLEALNAGTGQDWINKNMVYPAIQNVLNEGTSNNSGQWGNVTANLKDHGIIAALDRSRQSNDRSLMMLGQLLKGDNKKRGGYNA